MATRERDEARGKRIRDLREQAGWPSQQALAEHLGVSLSTANGWERGYKLVQPAAVELARALSTTTDYLYGRTSDPTPPDDADNRSVDQRLAAIEGMIRTLSGMDRRRAGNGRLRDGYQEIQARIADLGETIAAMELTKLREAVDAQRKTLEELVLAVRALQSRDEAQRQHGIDDTSPKSPPAKRRPRGQKGG